MKTLQVTDRIGAPINIGCGPRYHATWLNLDLGSHSPHVVEWDSRDGLPVPDASAPFVYSSHMLEHLEPEDAAALLREIHRALLPGGIVRVVVPDLAKLCRWYLESLAAGAPESFATTWSRIHFLDQLVRMEPGGRMKRILVDCSEEELVFAASRMGSEALDTRRAARPTSSQFFDRLPAGLKRPRVVHRVLQRVGMLGARSAVGALLGRRGSEALRRGWFATSGESHRWMYDSNSLRHLLTGCGFSEIREASADSSDWPGWESANLDRDPDGQVYKPDSLYMEGRKSV